VVVILGLGVSSRREDREARVFGASHANDFEPVGARQVEVRDDEVPLLIPEQLNALITVLRMHDLIPASRREERSAWSNASSTKSTRMGLRESRLNERSLVGC